jgi:hypothetical protein
VLVRDESAALRVFKDLASNSAFSGLRLRAGALHLLGVGLPLALLPLNLLLVEDAPALGHQLNDLIPVPHQLARRAAVPALRTDLWLKQQRCCHQDPH